MNEVAGVRALPRCGGSRGILEACFTLELGGRQQSVDAVVICDVIYIFLEAFKAGAKAPTLIEVLFGVGNKEEASDTDTVGVITELMISGGVDLKDDVPEVLNRLLEQGEDGAEYLRKMDLGKGDLFGYRRSRTSIEEASNKTWT